MEATAILSSEHRVIERVIAALDAAAARIDADEPVRAGFFVDAARFIREFADGYHHGKEEHVLFDAMARNGMPTRAGPIAVMLHEHERGRELTRGLREAGERFAAGDADAASVAADYARAYGELLTQHIHKEDMILFPMAAQVIDATEHGAVLQSFERVEAGREAGGSKASLVALADALCDEMQVAERAAAVSP